MTNPPDEPLTANGFNIYVRLGGISSVDVYAWYSKAKGEYFFAQKDSLRPLFKLTDQEVDSLPQDQAQMIKDFVAHCSPRWVK